MNPAYRLNCPKCQRTLAITPAQAGESLTCECGHELTVPTLRQLRQLPTCNTDQGAAARPTGPPAKPWSRSRGFTFALGLLLVAVGVLVHFRLAPQRKALDISPPAFQEIDRDVQQLPAKESWDAWKYFRQQKLDDRPTPDFVKNRSKHRELTALLYAAWATTASGLALMAAAWLWPHPPSPSHP